MEDVQRQAKLLAQAIFDIRVLLASHLGSQSSSPAEVRVAAHLAYVLHNQALAVIEGKPFDIEASLEQIRSVDRMFGERLAQGFERAIRGADV